MYNSKFVLQSILLILMSIFIAFPIYPQSYKYPYSSFRERDPFKPLVDENGQILIKERRHLGDFLLQGIIYSPGGSQVVINNEVYKEGDNVEGYKVKKINAYGVIFEKNGEEFILKWEGK